MSSGTTKADEIQIGTGLKGLKTITEVLFALTNAFLLLSVLIQFSSGEILEVYPNPYGDDSYEYVIVRVTCENQVITDGEGYIPLNGNVSEIMTIAKNGTAYKNKFGIYPDLEAEKIDPGFALSNSGEELRLLCDGFLEDSFVYGRESNGVTGYLNEGVIYFRVNGSWDFRYEDWTSFKPISDYVSGRIIVHPNEIVLDANESLILVSYTLTDRMNLIELAKKGVKVEIYLDASPVGGIPVEEATIVKELDDIAEIHFLSSNSFKNFHYKFAVIDDRKVIITTENWKTTNRGYTVEFESEKIAKRLKELVKHDSKYSSEHGKISDEGRYANFYVNSKKINLNGEVELFILPDYNPVLEFISSSKDELLISVPYIDLSWFGDAMMLHSIENACENGSRVRILLDSKYSVDRNLKVVNFLNGLAEERGYDLEAKLVKLKGFDSLHGKMVYSDGECLITSANFNKYGLKLNREVGIIIGDESACEMLKEQFYDDWKDRFEIGAPGLLNSPFSDIVAILSFLASVGIYSRFSKLR